MVKWLSSGFVFIDVWFISAFLTESSEDHSLSNAVCAHRLLLAASLLLFLRETKCIWGNPEYNVWRNLTYSVWGNLKYNIWGNPKYSLWGNLKYNLWGNTKYNVWGNLKYIVWGNLKNKLYGET